MNFKGQNKIGMVLIICLAMASLLLLPASAIATAEGTSTQYFKMLSTVEYDGNGQFRHQVESLFNVKKQLLPDNRVHYFISSNDFDLTGGSLAEGQSPSSKEVSFIVDKGTKRLSEGGEDLALFTTVNNKCVESLKKISRDNIGKTWNQSFDLSFLGSMLPKELKFNLTAIEPQTEAFGKMIAVRALSEPFIVRVTDDDGKEATVQARINSAYLFDPQIEDVYMSVSVFECQTNMNGFKESLRHEVATYRTNEAGKSVDLTGLGKDFESLVRKVGLSRTGLKITKIVPLPAWVQTKGLRAAQVSNICAAVACEGSLNPVAAITISAARTVGMQAAGKLVAAGKMAAISSTLATSVTGIGSMKVAAAPAIMGMSAGTAGAVAGGTAGGVAIANNGSSSSSSRSPSTP